MSQGEDLIVKLLQKAKIPFEKEKTFYDLKKGKYRYDFYIEDLRGQRAVIEYNGAQHYEYIPKFYSSTRMWLAALERDRRKISYALANNIQIYIIPYWDYAELKTAADLFQSQYLATSRWHNDEVREKLTK